MTGGGLRRVGVGGIGAVVGVVVSVVAAACGGPPLHERYDANAVPTSTSSSASPGDFDGDASPSTRLCGPAVARVDGGGPVQIAARHVLIQWMGARRAADTVVRNRNQARAAAEDVLRRARAGDDLGRLATEYSDEPGAGARAGSLGCFRRGMMDRRFEEAAFALKPGQVSDIVESEFGFHIIQRIE